MLRIPNRYSYTDKRKRRQNVLACIIDSPLEVSGNRPDIFQRFES